jgi:hypothetical protein
MQFYKLWHKDNERGKNYLVAADGTEEAKQVLIDHLNQTANFHSASMFRVGIASKWDSDWITVWKEEDPGSWGWLTKTKTTAWEEWERCKQRGTKKFIAEFTP